MKTKHRFQVELVAPVKNKQLRDISCILRMTLAKKSLISVSRKNLALGNMPAITFLLLALSLILQHHQNCNLYYQTR